MAQPKLKGIANGISYSLRLKGKNYELRFTDPRSHKRVFEPTKTAVLREAHAYAANFLQDYKQGRDNGKMMVKELVDNMLAEKKAHQPRNFIEKRRNWTLRLMAKIGNWDHRDLTPQVITHLKNWMQGLDVPAHYGWKHITETTGVSIDERLDENGKIVGSGEERTVQLDVISWATINLDLSVLSLAYNRGIEDGVISYKPPIRKYSDKELKKFIRKGFLVQSQFDRIMALPLPVWLKAMLAVAYTAGNRASELKKMQVCQLDFLNRIVRLNPGETKNSDGRVIGMTEQMYQLLTACTWGKGPDDLVFTRDDRGQNGGNGQVGDFRKLWESVLEQAGITRRVPGTDKRVGRVTLHDFRRSAVRNMLRRGVDQQTALRIGGWKPGSGYKMLDRYNVVIEEDMVAAAQKIEQGAALERALAQQQAAIGPKLGHEGGKTLDQSSQAVVN